MTLRRRPPRRRGLSLIEVLVTIGIVLALGTAMASFVLDLRRSRERSAEAIETQRSAEALLEAIEAALATTVVEDAMLGVGLRGGSGRLEVVSRTVAAWRLGDPPRRHLSLEDRERLTVASEGPRRTRIARSGAAGGEGGRGEAPMAVRFRYFDGREWLDAFDSLDAGRLPRAVEVTLWWSAAPPPLELPDDAEAGPAAEFEVAFAIEEEFDDVAVRLDEPLVDGAGFDEATPDRRRVIAIIDPAAASSLLLPLAMAGSSRLRRRRTRRGVVLMAVLVVAGIGLLLAGTMLLLVRGETASSSRAAEAVRSRSLAWSGVQAVLAELAAQRPAILAGERPQLDPQYLLGDDGPRLGVVRLLPAGPGGERISPESSRLDLATITAERLVASGLADEALAAAVIAARDAVPRGRLDSVAGLLAASATLGAAGRAIDGVDLHGPLEELDLRGALAGEQGDLAERVLERLDGPRLRGLLDLLTVHAAENWLDAEGTPRISIRPPWSEEMGAAIEARFAGDLADAVRMLLAGEAIFDGKDLAEGLSLDSDRDLMELLVRVGALADEASEIVAGLTFDPEPLRTGRLDLNSASLEAIRTLPGIDEDQAAAIVEVREQLSPQERLDPLWPLLREILRLEQYPEIIELIGVRSACWRLRIACGTVDAESPEGPIEQATVWEIVVDLSGESARLAAIREITLLDLAAQLSLRMPALDLPEREVEDRAERMLAGLPEGSPEAFAEDLDAIGGSGDAFSPPFPEAMPTLPEAPRGDPLPSRRFSSEGAASSSPPRPAPGGMPADATREGDPRNPGGAAGSPPRGGTVGRWRRLP